MTRRFRQHCCAIFVAAYVLPACLAGASPDRRVTFHVPVHQLRLKNGLRVVLSPDGTAPTYSICVAYGVGSRDEQPGHTGLAHLLEHMMFQGSSNVGPQEHNHLVRTYGGVVNATTNTDRTNYYESLAANQLELGLFLEAERMRNLDLNSERLDAERSVVIEERHNRIENRAYGRTAETLSRMAYRSFAYGHPMIGSADDIRSVTVEELRRWHQAYYAPNNAVLALVGNFRIDQAAKLVRKYFGSIPARVAPPEPNINQPLSPPAKRGIIRDPFAKFPRVDIAYRAPAGNTPDWYSLAVAGDVLADGRFSKLHKLLVQERGLATDVSWTIQQRRGEALGIFVITAINETRLAAAEMALYAELERFEKEPATRLEIESAARKFVSATAARFYRTLDRAIVLSEFALFYNSPELINSFAANLYSIRAVDIQRAVRMYWTAENRTVVVTIPDSPSR